MQYDLPTSEDQQELAATEIESEQDMVTDKRPPVENQIVGYNEAQDQYVLRSAGETSYVDSSEPSSVNRGVLNLEEFRTHTKFV
jgi:hypothetical protein